MEHIQKLYGIFFFLYLFSYFKQKLEEHFGAKQINNDFLKQLYTTVLIL